MYAFDHGMFSTITDNVTWLIRIVLFPDGYMLFPYLLASETVRLSISRIGDISASGLWHFVPPHACAYALLQTFGLDTGLSADSGLYLAS